MTDAKIRRRCFVLMPFAPKYTEVYEQVYRPICENNNVECWRVDEIARPGSITKDIVEGIIEADIVIADLTSKNPNVFYELGIAHSIGNKTIMTSQSKDDVPFDIASYRVIFYEQTISGSKELAKKLDSAIKELLKALDQANNPVQEVLSNRFVVGFKRRTPLVQVIDVAKLRKALRDFLQAENIVYADELVGIDLNKIKVKYGLGKASLENLVRLLLVNGLYDDINKLHQFIMENRLSTGEKSRW
jgi:hypothetical protein